MLCFNREGKTFTPEELIEFANKCRIAFYQGFAYRCETHMEFSQSLPALGQIGPIFCFCPKNELVKNNSDIVNLSEFLKKAPKLFKRDFFKFIIRLEESQGSKLEITFQKELGESGVKQVFFKSDSDEVLRIISSLLKSQDGILEIHGAPIKISSFYRIRRHRSPKEISNPQHA